MTSGPRLTSPPFSRDAGARTSNRHHLHHGEPVPVPQKAFSARVQWATNQLQCSQRSCARRQRCRKDRHDDSVGTVIRRGQSAIKAARVASPLAWPGSTRYQSACSARGTLLSALSGSAKGRSVVDLWHRRHAVRASVLCCACRRAAHVAMRSGLCPPVSACGMRMRKSEPAACWRAWQSSEESVSGRRCAAIVTRSHGRPFPIA